MGWLGSGFTWDSFRWLGWSLPHGPSLDFFTAWWSQDSFQEDKTSVKALSSSICITCDDVPLIKVSLTAEYKVIVHTGAWGYHRAQFIAAYYYNEEPQSSLGPTDSHLSYFWKNWLLLPKLSRSPPIMHQTIGPWILLIWFRSQHVVKALRYSPFMKLLRCGFISFRDPWTENNLSSPHILSVQLWQWNTQ